MPPTTTQAPSAGLDPQIVNLAKAIRQTESNNNFTAQGASGEYGAYQFEPATWNATAPKYGINVPLQQATPEQQNEVAYKQLADWKVEHPDWNIGNFASAWNAGAGDPNAYLENHTGTNAEGVSYDTPTYAKNVATAYQAFKNGVAPTVPESAAPAPSIGGFLGNVVQSGANLAGNVLNAVVHPIQTAQNIGNMAVGGLDELGGQTNTQTQAFDQLKNYFANRYGSAQDIGNTVYKDPIGFLADLSTAFTGAGGLVGAGAKLADVAGLGDAAEASGVAGALKTGANALGTAADYTNPLAPVVAGGKALAGISAGAAPLAAQGANLLTGGGADAASTLFRAANEGGDAATAARTALRGGDSPDAIVNDAVSAYQKIGDQQSADIVSKLEGIKGIKASLDISPVFDQLKTQLQKFGLADAEGNPITDASGNLDFSRSAIAFDKPAQTDIQTIVDTLKNYGTKEGDRTPAQIHILKRAFGSLYSKNSESRAFVTAMRQSVRQVLSQVDGYDEMTKSYADTEKMLDDLKGTFSIGGNAKYDTIFKKLTASLRQNDAFKTEMLGKLSEAGGAHLEERIAGLSYSPYFARNLIGKGLEAGGIYTAMKGLISPQYIGTALATSPRLMGEFIMALGASTEEASHFTKALTALKKVIPVADVAQASQGEGQQEPVPTPLATQ